MIIPAACISKLSQSSVQQSPWAGDTPRLKISEHSCGSSQGSSTIKPISGLTPEIDHGSWSSRSEALLCASSIWSGIRTWLQFTRQIPRFKSDLWWLSSTQTSNGSRDLLKPSDNLTTIYCPLIKHHGFATSSFLCTPSISSPVCSAKLHSSKWPAR